ncbi:MAG: hypothetical protein KDE31_08990 [Caldilineaceae bacterium]|nr:hypothetical protein [Caldilineaceae bacterium]
MQLFRVRLTQQSALLTEPTSGVLMGHLAWAYRYLYGAAELTALLDAYRTADAAAASPPLICSAALPQDMLPRPPFNYLTPAQRTALAQTRYADDGRATLLQLERELGRLRHVTWVPRSILAELCEDLSAVALIARLLDAMPQLAPRIAGGPIRPEAQDAAGPARLDGRVRTQPGINRLTGAVQDGILFDTNELVYRPSQELEIWVRIAPDYADDTWLTRWEACFALLDAQGIGARKSAGSGRIRLTANLTAVPATALPAAAQPNAFITLASWTPRATDPAAHVYRLDTRHGRLGGLYGAGEDVWKYPVTELLPGAVGLLPPATPLRPVYGRLLADVHRTRPEIVNFAYAFPIGITLRHEE